MSLPDGSQEQGKLPLITLFSARREDVGKFGCNAAAIKHGLALKLAKRWETQAKTGNTHYIRDGKEWIDYPIGKRAKGQDINVDWTFLSNDFPWMCDRTYRDGIKMLSDPKVKGGVGRMTDPHGRCIYRAKLGTTVRRPDWYGMSEDDISKIIHAEPEDLVHWTPVDALEMGITDAILFNKICFLFEMERPESGYITLCPTSLGRLTGLKRETVRVALARLAKRWKRLERISVKGRAGSYKLTAANPLAGKFLTPEQKEAKAAAEKAAEVVPVRESKPAQTPEELTASGAVKVREFTTMKEPEKINKEPEQPSLYGEGLAANIELARKYALSLIDKN